MASVCNILEELQLFVGSHSNLNGKAACLNHLLIGLIQHTLLGVVLKEYFKAQLVKDNSDESFGCHMCCLCSINCTGMLLDAIQDVGGYL